MPKTLPIAIPVTGSLEALRQYVVNRFNTISLRIAQTDRRTQPMSMGGYRLTDVPDPANATDAVNLRTLKKELQGVGNKHQQKQIPVTGYFTTVFSNAGTSSATFTSPPYVFNPHRLGVPGEIKVYAIGTGTSSSTVNVVYVPRGTGTPANLLTAAINLPASKTGPISSVGFAILPSFKENDVIYAVGTGGGISNFSIELLVNP